MYMLYMGTARQSWVENGGRNPSSRLSSSFVVVQLLLLVVDSDRFSGGTTVAKEAAGETGQKGKEKRLKREE